MVMTIYVEGGGHHNQRLVQRAKAGFRQFLIRAGIRDRAFTVFFSGSRNEAYKDYYDAVGKGKPAMLLVDSEGPVPGECRPGDDMRRWKPWDHLRWDVVGDDADCHLMVQAMEAWLLADEDALRAYYGKGYKPGKTPADIETIAKDGLEALLKDAARETSKRGYDKGRDSFLLLGSIDPEKVKARSKWAKRFLDLLWEKTQGGHPA